MRPTGHDGSPNFAFGVRPEIAFDLGRFSASALGGASEPSTWTLLALAALPALAVDGLVLSAFGSRIGIGRRLGRPLALALSLPGLLLATAVLALTLRAAGGSPFVDGPAPGLYLAAAAGLVLLVALLPRRPFRRAARASRTARRGTREHVPERPRELDAMSRGSPAWHRTIEPSPSQSRSRLGCR